MQFFWGYKEFDDCKPPFDASTMVYFRKRLTPEILGEINELIIKKASEPERTSAKEATSGKEEVEDNKTDTVENDDKHDEPKPPSNSGTLIVDATCAPSNIEYPQDTALLNEGREKLEKIIDELYDPKDGVKPRTYRKQAHKDYLKTARKRRKSEKDIRKAVGKNNDNCDRVEVERAFSLAKSKYGLGLIRARLKQTTQSAIALSILALNLERIWCAFFQMLLSMLLKQANFLKFHKYTFVQ